MRNYFKTGNGSFVGMDVLPEDTMEQLTHKIQDKGGIKPCNVSLYMVDSLCNCGKTVYQLLLEHISAEIEIEYKPFEENDRLLDSNDVSMSHINFLYEKVKRNHLIDEILRNLELELKGPPKYTEIKHEIKSMYDNNGGGTMKGIDKEISFLKRELANTNQLLPNLHNKNSTCFLQFEAFTRKPTEESNENIDFDIETPPQCLEGDDILKTKLDEQLKEILKCYHQKYLNTKPIINNINKNNCLEQNC